ncbi:hypothetical protein ACMBCQ_02515, partial [Candidatus Phytoplasma citri]
KEFLKSKKLSKVLEHLTIFKIFAFLFSFFVRYNIINSILLILQNSLSLIICYFLYICIKIKKEKRKKEKRKKGA